MKYVIVETREEATYRYLVAVEDEAHPSIAAFAVLDGAVDDIYQDHHGQEILNITSVESDDDIRTAIEGSYIEEWPMEQIKEVFASLAQKHDTSEK